MYDSKVKVTLVQCGVDDCCMYVYFLPLKVLIHYKSDQKPVM